MTDFVVIAREQPSRTWGLTNGLRWLCVGTERTLQQGWLCRETGEVEWRDVPLEEHKL